MAKAKAKLSDMMPKLVFRENGAARTEGSFGLKEKNVRIWLLYIASYTNYNHLYYFSFVTGRI